MSTHTHAHTHTRTHTLTHSRTGLALWPHRQLSHAAASQVRAVRPKAESTSFTHSCILRCCPTQLRAPHAHNTRADGQRADTSHTRGRFLVGRNPTLSSLMQDFLLPQCEFAPSPICCRTHPRSHHSRCHAVDSLTSVFPLLLSSWLLPLSPAAPPSLNSIHTPPLSAHFTLCVLRVKNGGACNKIGSDPVLHSAHHCLCPSPPHCRLPVLPPPPPLL